VIRGNRFINTFHAISAMGGHLHVLENDISVPEPQRVPGVGHPSFAISFCGDHNLVARNRIEGHPDGIELSAWGKGCRHNVIRDNTIKVRRVPLPGSRLYPDLARITDVADSTIVGVPLLLTNGTGEAPLEDNLIERNRFLGAEGIAIELSGGARNRILDNSFSAIRVRDPFPGNGLGAPPAWEIANGSAIWVSPGSEQNEIRGNTFDEIASYMVVLEGDRNVVEVRGAGDGVRDLGSGNRVEQAPYQSRFVETRGIRLHYLDFGGAGLPLIFVHDWYEDAHTWTTMAPPFADAHRVLAMTRRGYGQSDDVGWGYDVATQAEDILGFMDALGVERAVLVGRHPTTQDMTWIAEHHPQRLAGLVYLYHAVAPSPGDARILRDRTFAEMFNRYGGCWMGEEAYERAAPRLLYRPHYIDDVDRRIGVPALSFTHPQDFAAGMVELDLLDVTLAEATSADPGGGLCDAASIEASVAWLTALAGDAERLAAARALVPTSAERRGYAEAFERAFGSKLRVVRLDGPADYRTNPDAYIPHMRAFLAGPVRSDTVHVAPPTGDRKADRASILAALEQVRPGGTVQFASGTYLVGELIPIETPRITLQGHPHETTLRACEPGEYHEMGNSSGHLTLGTILYLYFW
jgi:pimeloyl-ACP methyl ester carboxylesterase